MTKEDGKREKRENEMIEEKRGNERERRFLSPLKAPDSIETRLLDSKLQNDGKE